MQAKYDPNYMYKTVLCDQCGVIIGYAYVPKDEEITIPFVHCRKRLNCLDTHKNSLMPKIEVEDNEFVISKKRKGKKNESETE